jgi:pimeloyl-ACP methyl ester carboxylesterase
VFRKLTKLLLVSLGVFAAVAGVAVGYSYLAYSRAMAIADPPGIIWAGYVPIGGIEQWVQIRGKNRENPVVLWLNGGPGFSTIPQTLFSQAWERDFTLVMWDQRGEGLTYAKSGRSVAPTMTIDRMAEDGIEVVEMLRSKLGDRKIVLLGHSWGSMLGIRMIRKRPDLFKLYVGTGQVTDLRRAADIGYRMVLDAARRSANARAVRELETVGPPPYRPIEKTWVPVKWENELDPGPRLTGRPTWAAVWAFLKFGQPSYWEGLRFSGEMMLEQMLSDNIARDATAFSIPVTFVQGAEDMVTPTELVRDYYEGIAAPRKSLHVIEDTGHLVLMKNRTQFIDIVKNELAGLERDGQQAGPADH